MPGDGALLRESYKGDDSGAFLYKAVFSFEFRRFDYSFENVCLSCASPPVPKTEMV